MQAETTMTHSDDTRVRLGVSACLVGQHVRFDGGHKRDPFLTGLFDPFVEWVPVCPEEEAGFGTPREAMHLARTGAGIRLLTVRSGRDLTDPLQAASSARLAQLASADLDGYVLKKDSPSCGLQRVKVYDPHGSPARSGTGFFARALCAAFPLLPVEEEGRLCDPGLREHFIARVFAYRRLRQLQASRTRPADLMRFHARHKLLLLAHSPAHYTGLGRMVAEGHRADPAALVSAYGREFMGALAVPASRGRHANVLQHMAGYLRRFVGADVRRDLSDTIIEYARGLLPLVVPVTLMAHHVKHHRIPYLLDQVYLQPHPKALMLRNHV
jgi:uncharacterized protein YbgA (DUF1722 family)/uncharacterized protein YbbK (DUF523 family)